MREATEWKQFAGSVADVDESLAARAPRAMRAACGGNTEDRVFGREGGAYQAGSASHVMRLLARTMVCMRDSSQLSGYFKLS